MAIIYLYETWTNEEKKQAIASMVPHRRVELMAQLLSAGYSAAELRSAGYSVAELRSAGYSVEEVLSAGYSVAELRSAGYSVAEVRSAGYSVAQLRSAGYSVAQLLSAGYSAAEVRSAGYSAKELLSADYSAAQVRSAGYSAAEVRSAGYSAAEVLSAGYSAAEEDIKKAKSDIQKKSRLMGKEESKFVVAQLKKGLFNGQSYGTIDSCGCLLGSAAKKAGLSVDEFCRKRGLDRDSSSPAEKWFMSVIIGDTPENNYAAEMGVKWILELLADWV